MTCDLMDGRDAFLTLARDKHYEFSSLRRAQFSTLCMLYELHNQGQDKFVYTCNNCKNHVETRYHCRVCDVSDRILPQPKQPIISMFLFLSFPPNSRIMIYVSVARRKLVIFTKWTNLDLIWMMAHHRVTYNKLIHKRPVNNPSKDASNHWYMRASVVTLIVGYHRARR